MNRCSFALAALVSLAAPMAAAQDDTNLEQEVRQALERHPEVLIAKAKVDQAEAEYQLVRMKIAQEVIEKRGALDLERARVGQLQQRLKGEHTTALENELIDAMRRVAQMEAGARLGAGGGGSAPAKPPAGIHVRPEPPAHYRDLLAVPVQLAFEQATIPMIAAALAKKLGAADGNPSLQIVVDTQGWSEELGGIDELKVDLQTPGSVTLRHVFEILADVTPMRFVLRDYGVLITTEHRARYTDAATIPADLPLLRE